MTMYAHGTTVSPERSRQEIEQTVRRYKAARFLYAEGEGFAAIGFELERRNIRILLPLPGQDDQAFATRRVRGRRSANATEVQRRHAWEKETRRRWRALALAIKAKLEAVESGIETVEEAFLAHMVVRDQQGRESTVGAQVIPQVVKAIEAGTAPRLALPGLGETGR